METSVHVNSSSTPSKPTVLPMYVKSDENDQNYPPSSANSNQCKLGETENAVKKKVLTDRNEAVDLKFNENSDFTNVDLKSTSCKEDSQTKSPYDPLTNYLSPRPRFLRFKPDRRKEILRRVGEEARKIGVCEYSVSVSRSSSSEEEEEETEMKEKEKLEEESEAKSTEEDENEDEGYVNRNWIVKDLSKLFFVIVSLFLCTAYITSMNSPKPSFEVSGAFRSSFCPILNTTGEFRSSVVAESINENGSHFWDEEVTEAAASNMNDDDKGVSQFDDHHEDERKLGFMQENEILNGEIEGVDFKLEYTEAKEMAEETIDEDDDDKCVSQCDDHHEDERKLGFMKENEILNGEIEGVDFKLEYTEAKEMAEETIDEEKVEDKEIGVEFSELSAKDVADDIPNQKEFGISDTIAEEVGDRQDEPDQENLLSDILTVAGKEYTSQMEVVEKEEAEELEPKSSAVEAAKITILERITNNLFGIVDDLKSVFVELMNTETETVLKAVLGLSVSSAILTCLIFSFQFKKKKYDKKEAAISVSVDRSNKAEEPATTKLTCDVERSNNEPIKNVEYPSKMLSSSIHSRDELESFKVMYHHEAPTVQFLSEFVVNDIGNSLKNESGFKNRTIEEAEDSNFPVLIEEKPVSKHMDSRPEQATSEFSTTTSPSYGSFTTKKKIAKKEVGGDGVVISTPVRRSTRIRNRIVSP